MIDISCKSDQRQAGCLPYHNFRRCLISKIALLMPILLSEYGEKKGKNLVVLSLVIAVGILLTTLGVSVIMVWMGLF